MNSPETKNESVIQSLLTLLTYTRTQTLNLAKSETGITLRLTLDNVVVDEKDSCRQEAQFNAWKQLEKPLGDLDILLYQGIIWMLIQNGIVSVTRVIFTEDDLRAYNDIKNMVTSIDWNDPDDTSLTEEQLTFLIDGHFTDALTETREEFSPNFEDYRRLLIDIFTCYAIDAYVVNQRAGNTQYTMLEIG